MTSAATRSRWLWVILFVAAALRLFPVWFGLPYLHARPDEGAAIGHAMAMLDGDLNPHFFHWPSLTFYLLAALFAVASAARGVVAGDTQLPVVEQILIGRVLIALAGTATVIVLFAIGRRMQDAATGLVAAALLAVAVLHVRDSHFAMTDILMTLLVTSAVALLLRALAATLRAARVEAAHARQFAAAGLVAGLATSTKYSAIAVAAGMAAAQCLIWVRAGIKPWSARGWLPSLGFFAALVAGFLATTPYAVLDFQTFSTDLLFDVTHLSGGHGINLGRGWRYHLTTSLPYGAGPLTVAAAAAGIFAVAWRAPDHALVLGAFAAAFYASIGSGYTVFFRYILPLVPVICLLAAAAVREAAASLARHTTFNLSTATITLAGLVAAPSAVHSVWLDLVLARTDSRVLAARWLAPRVQAGHTLYDSGGDYATLDLGTTRYHVWRFDPATKSFGHPRGDTPDWLVLHQSPLRTYGRHPMDVRQLAATAYDLVWELRATRGSASAAVYDLQDAFFLPLSRFDTVVRPGPSIFIYRKR